MNHLGSVVFGAQNNLVGILFPTRPTQNICLCHTNSLLFFCYFGVMQGKKVFKENKNTVRFSIDLDSLQFFFRFQLSSNEMAYFPAHNQINRLAQNRHCTSYCGMTIVLIIRLCLHSSARNIWFLCVYFIFYNKNKIKKRICGRFFM